MESHDETSLIGENDMIFISSIYYSLIINVIRSKW